MGRILWIGKETTDAAAGDEIYDRKMKCAARALGATIHEFSVPRVSRFQEICNNVCGVIFNRSRYLSSKNIEAIRAACREADVVICSWEPLDRLAFFLDCPTVVIVHNVTSVALPSLFNGHWLARLAAGQARRWETKCYAPGSFRNIAVLSMSDAAILTKIRHGAPVLFAPPGMPPLAPLRADACFKGDLIISGTYGWRPKLRDVVAFAHELHSLTSILPTIYADGLPGSASKLLNPLPLSTLQSGDAIRLGVVPDRFQAGFKLKASYYIANNSIVLSFSDISADYNNIVDADIFIRHISHASEIPKYVEEFSAMSQSDLVQRFSTFKRACADRFRWDESARILLDAAGA